MPLQTLHSNRSRSQFHRAALLGLAGIVTIAGGTSALHAQTWNIQWSDEFNGAANTPPSANTWTFDLGNNNGWGNAELEFYCAPFANNAPCNSSQPNLYEDGNGNLVIHAIKTNGTWTSGRMNTSGKQAFQYGRIEARMKLQQADGFWPAFWMLGNNLSQVGWPQAGEQDIMEWVQSYGANTTSSTIHGPGYSGGAGIGSRFTFPNGERIDDSTFHTYGVLWSPNQMQFYRDNPAKPFFTMTPANIPAGKQWVYNQPFFVLLNFAIGSGGFPGPTDGSTPNSGTALVDYVRVYSPSTAAINPAAWYTVNNANSGLCLDDANSGTGTGTPVQQNTCTYGQWHQEWQFTPTDSGYYKVTSRNTPLVWDVTGGPGATGNSVPVQLWSYGGGANQQWKPVALGNGTFQFVARHSGLCLDTPAASTNPGQQLQQYTCNNTGAQSFLLSQQD